MCGRVAAPPEEWERGLGISRNVEDKIDHVKKFYSDLKTHEYTFTHILKNIVKSDLLEKDLSFSVGIECLGELLLPDKKTDCWEGKRLEKYEKQLGEYEIRQGRYDLIKQCFLEQYDLSNGRSVEWCRCIGGLPYLQTEDTGFGYEIYVYYFISLNDEKLDRTFLRCAEEAYYEWCRSQLVAVLHAVSPEKVIENLNRDEVIKQFHRDVADNFHRYMWNMFSIEPEVITAVSGIYYEGETCCSRLSFCLTDVGNLHGVTLKPPITVETGKIKRIRKLLQMGKEGQCLLICRKDQQWQVRGLYEENGFSAKSINFQIIKHMVWKMLTGEKLTVCFENGNYVIESREFELNEVEKKYIALFGKEFAQQIKMVCEEAAGQKHGTTLVIIEKEQSESETSAAEQEVDRLIEESAGMKMEPMFLEKGFVNSVTSIDGALIADPEGKCYGFGMILDGSGEGKAEQNEENQKGKSAARGNADYGARHNSALRYIRKCRDNGFKAMAVVVSEDGPVTSFATNEI